MQAILTELLVVALLIAANGVLALAEMALISARRARLEVLAAEGHAGARAALVLRDAPNRFLSTVQIGITLVGVLAGAFSGATLAEALGERLNLIPGLAPYAEAIGVGVVVLAITYFSLVAGELVPKRLALNDPERAALALAPAMRALSRLAGPLVRLLGASTDFVLRLLRVRPSAEPAVTEEELRALLEQGTRSGTFAAVEQDMVEAVLRLGDQRASSLATPRTALEWLSPDDPPDVVRAKIARNPLSWLPVAQGGLDNVLGVVDTRDLLARLLGGQRLDLRAALRPPTFVPENSPALRVLEALRQSGHPLALIIDEHGGVQGILTLQDLLEAIVGAIPRPGAPLEPGAVQRPDGSWLIDGMMPIDRFKEQFDLRDLPGESRGYYDTLAGFVLYQLGRIPAPGDAFEYDELRYEVLDLDGRRVDKVLVSGVRQRASGIGQQADR